ncbi:MAG: hypothetical protein AAF492_08475, partial [Verrucomicrobiota bacterium]
MRSFCFVLLIVGSAAPASAEPFGWSYTNWTGDADAGTTNHFNYTATHNFGDNHAGVTVNGVFFPESFATSGPGWSIGGAVALWNGDDDAAVAGNSEDLAEEFVYNGNPRTVQLTGLTTGQRYKATFFSAGWEAAGRIQTFASDGDNLVLDQDVFGNNNGLRVSYVYLATNTTRDFTITPVGGTFHLYALANHELIDFAVTNSAAVNIGTTNADLVGLLDATGAVSVSVYLSTNNPADAVAWLADTTATNLPVGMFSNVSLQAVTGAVSMLFSNRTYFYTMVASNAVTSLWAQPNARFETIGFPAVDNAGGALAGLPFDATLRGGLTDGTGADAYIVWGDNDPGTLNTGDWDQVISIGPVRDGQVFSAAISGLAELTTYYYRCFVTNEVSFAWSGVTNFTTSTSTNIMINNANAPNAWNVPGNWSRGRAPFDGETAVIDRELFGSINSIAPSFSGDLILLEEATLRGWTDLNAMASVLPSAPPAHIVLHDRARLILRAGDLSLGPIDLRGDAVIEGGAAAVGIDTQRDFNHEIGGSGSLTLVGVSNNTFNLNAGNQFSGGFSTEDSQNEGFRIRANADGAFGLGDVTIGSNATVYISSTQTVSDAAALLLDGPKSGMTNDPAKVVMETNETVFALFVDGVRQRPGTWGSSASGADNQDDILFSGPGILLVDGSIALTKTVSESIIRPGSNLTYTLDVANYHTGALSGVVVTDALPLSVDFVSSFPPADQINGNRLGYDLGAIPTGSNILITIEVTVTATPPASLTITNLAIVTVTNTTVSPTSVTDAAETLLFRPVDVAITKTVTRFQSNLIYTLTVTNRSGVDALDVRV